MIIGLWKTFIIFLTFNIHPLSKKSFIDRLLEKDLSHSHKKNLLALFLLAFLIGLAIGMTLGVFM
ncbi:MAG: hypothetical protein QW303_03595 [Nitrososphaerota archaeon]